MRLGQLGDASRQRDGDGIRVAIVQGGLRSGRADLEAANEEAWDTYSKLTLALADPARSSDGRLADPGLIIWPETVLRVYLRSDETYRPRLRDLVERIGRAVLIGSLDWAADDSGEYNSAYLLFPRALRASHTGAFAFAGGERGTDESEKSLSIPSFDSAQDMLSQRGKPVRAQSATFGLREPLRAEDQVYRKRYLLPFGEYVPGARWLPLLGRWKTTGAFLPSPEATVFELEGPIADARVRLAPSICFEAIWPGWFNQMVRGGADLLVNLTDDGWYGQTLEPHQHLQLARMRAVETRRWLVRASNSGISAFIDPTGEIVASLPLNEVGTLEHTVMPLLDVPLYVRIGDWPVALSAVIVGLCILLAVKADG